MSVLSCLEKEQTVICKKKMSQTRAIFTKRNLVYYSRVTCDMSP